MTCIMDVDMNGEVRAIPRKITIIVTAVMWNVSGRTAFLQARHIPSQPHHAHPRTSTRYGDCLSPQTQMIGLPVHAQPPGREDLGS